MLCPSLPVEDHRCSAAAKIMDACTVKDGHSPLSRIIVVLPLVTEYLKPPLIVLVTVPCRGSSLFCHAEIHISAGPGWLVTVPCRGSSLFCPEGSDGAYRVDFMSQSPVEDHRCSARHPSRSQDGRVRVTVPCRGSSLFCPTSLSSWDAPMTQCHSPLSRIIVVLPVLSEAERRRWGNLSQSPVEDHRCSARQNNCQ